MNALGLLLRLYMRGEIGTAKERLTTLLDELKNEVLLETFFIYSLRSDLLVVVLVQIRRCRFNCVAYS